VTGKPLRLRDFLALAGALSGLVLLRPAADAGSHQATLLAVFSGVTAALAYLMVSRVRESRSPFLLMTSWCGFSLLAHLVWIALRPPLWPTSPVTWMWVALGGALASLAQYFVTLAYQKDTAPRVTALLYAGPALGLILDAAFFGVPLGPQKIFGVAVILGFGVALPLELFKRRRRAGATLVSEASGISEPRAFSFPGLRRARVGGTQDNPSVFASPRSNPKRPL